MLIGVKRSWGLFGLLPHHMRSPLTLRDKLGPAEKDKESTYRGWGEATSRTWALFALQQACWD